MNSLKNVLSPFKLPYMLLMDYPYIREEELSDYAKKGTWNLLHAYIDVHIQILIYEYPGYGVQAISILQYQYENMIVTGKSEIIDCFR